MSERDRNRVYLEQIAMGSETALAQLVEENMGLVRSIARRFVDRGTEMEDLLQIGAIGMIKAAKSFDFSFETTFSTYAVPLIMGELRRHLRDDGPVKVGRKLREQGLLVLRERERIRQHFGREAGLGEIAQSLCMTKEEVAAAVSATAAPRSLDERIGSEEDGALLGELLPDPTNALEQLTDHLALRQAIDTLTPLHRRILHLRYDKSLSQQQTGQLLGMSQVKISREEKKILSLLRQAL